MIHPIDTIILNQVRADNLKRLLDVVTAIQRVTAPMELMSSKVAK